MKYYLCGPMASCDNNECSEWRAYCQQRLGSQNCLDPMVRDYRDTQDFWANRLYESVVDPDINDILKSDIVIANLWKNSIGSTMEVLYGYNLGKLVLSVQPNVQHPWIIYHSHYVFKSVESLVGSILELQRSGQDIDGMRSIFDGIKKTRSGDYTKVDVKF
jgi:hypothetical protein